MTAPEITSAAIIRETGATERLASDLSMVSRVEAGAGELHPTDFAPETLLADAYERFASSYEDQGVALLVVTDGVFPPVTGDPEWAAQVLANLLGNALRRAAAG